LDAVKSLLSREQKKASVGAGWEIFLAGSVALPRVGTQKILEGPATKRPETARLSLAEGNSMTHRQPSWARGNTSKTPNNITAPPSKTKVEGAVSDDASQGAPMSCDAYDGKLP
jgi:hypothetical protein